MSYKGTKKFKKGEEPWLQYGLTKGAYYTRKRRGIPFDALLTRGRKGDVELHKIEQELDYLNKAEYGRFSGLDYENSPEKLKSIKEKYKNGVTKDIIAEMMERFLK